MNLEQLLDEFKCELNARYGDRLVNMVLYGSHARGDATADSDVDLVIVLRGAVAPGEEIDRVVDLLATFNLQYGALISVFPVSLEIFQTDSLFWRNVHREGVVV